MNKWETDIITDAVINKFWMRANAMSLIINYYISSQCEGLSFRNTTFRHIVRSTTIEKKKIKNIWYLNKIG